MDSKKFNIFAFVMVIVMCAFSIFIGVANKPNDGEDGNDGYSAYELAIKNGLISSEMSETQYLQSLYGKDGTSVTLEDIYNAYLKETGKTKDELTYTEFILSYYPDKIVGDNESVSLVENTTQQALRSTVDICYSFDMDTPIIYGSFSDSKFVIDSNYENTYVSVGVSAGSGVIYDYEDTDDDGISDVAYIVTNYHVVYCSNYSSDSNYYVYYDENTENYFTATYDESQIKTQQVSNGWWYQTIKYLPQSSLEYAPLHTHFLDDYGIYLYGHQSKEYRISASFVGGSAENDIAVLKVERDKNLNNELLFGNDYKAVELGNSSELNEGETIVAVGNPLLADTSNVDSSSVGAYVESAENAYIDALCLTSTSGEISNLSEYCVFQSLLDSSKTNSMRLIRVSSAINAGNSGGGLYSSDGRLVGIVNGKIASSNYDNVGYAIPIDIVKNLVSQIISQCDNKETETRIKTLTEKSLGLTVKNGKSNSYYDSTDLCWRLAYNVEVSEVSGLSLDAGIQVGDILKSFEVNGNTYDLNFEYDLNDKLLNISSPESSICFNVIRLVSGVETTKKITINLTDSSFVEII